MNTQNCIKCGEDYSLTSDYWYKNRVLKSGFQYVCIKCTSIFMKEYNQSIRGRYSHYKVRAKQDRKEFKLSLNDFKEFWQKPCYYCGSDIKTIGLDRLNNHIGYIKSNLNPFTLSLIHSEN